jgi:hypothetical protein
MDTIPSAQVIVLTVDCTTERMRITMLPANSALDYENWCGVRVPEWYSILKSDHITVGHNYRLTFSDAGGNLAICIRAGCIGSARRPPPARFCRTRDSQVGECLPDSRHEVGRWDLSATQSRATWCWTWPRNGNSCVSMACHKLYACVHPILWILSS